MLRVLLAITTLITFAVPVFAGETRRWNVLSPDLGCYGDEYASTPNLDLLASQGVRYDLAFASAPVCSPSRSSIITGMYAPSIGTHHHRSNVQVPEGIRTFTAYLRDAGYYCTNNAKTDYNFPVPPDAWDESSNKAHWRNRDDPSQPFFAVFNLNVCHEGQVRAEDDVFERHIRNLPPDRRHDPAKAMLPPYYPDTPIVRENWARYYDLVSVMDMQVAELLRQLEEDGLADDTVVFFWGDHGRGLPRAKRWLYDSGVRVPLIVRWPGEIAPGTVSRNLISLVDLGPAVLSITGVPIPPHMHGQAFLGPQQIRPRRRLFFHRDRMDETHDMMRAVRDQRFKYIRNYCPDRPYALPIRYMDEMPIMQEWRRRHEAGELVGPQRLFFSPQKPPEELYDTIADPHEIDNLAGSPQHYSTLIEMRGRLNNWVRAINDRGFEEEDPAQQVRPRTRNRPATK
jgi:N-sulfoglucosamine sulfohydrolase